MQTVILCRGVDVKLHAFLTLVPEGGEWSASCCIRFTPGECDPRTHSVGIFGTSASVWMLWQRQKSLATAENEAMMLQLSSV